MSSRIINIALLIIFFLFGLFPILPFNLKPIGLIIGLVLGFYIFLNVKKWFFSKYFLFNSLVFILYFISIFYSEDLKDAFQRIETSLSLILFPLFFFLISNTNLNSINSIKIEKIFFSSFYVSTLIFCLITVFYLNHLGFFAKTMSYEVSMAYIRDQLWFGLYEHPIYISIMLSLSLLFSFELLKHFQNNQVKYLIVLGNILLLGFLVFFSRKGVIFGALVSITFLVLSTYKISKIRVFSSVAILLIVSFLLLPRSLERIKDLFQNETYSNSIDENSSTNIRLSIYKCAFKTIPEAGFFGLGIGDVKNALRNCYSSTSDVLLKFNYNTHNQYLNSLLVNGIVGLSILVFVFYQNIHFSVKNKDYLFLSIILFYLIIMMTENILDRQNGVYLFSLLTNYFIFKNNFKNVDY